jgi:hypothetical protein
MKQASPSENVEQSLLARSVMGITMCARWSM